MIRGVDSVRGWNMRKMRVMGKNVGVGKVMMTERDVKSIEE
jgi:hypothetical protein